MTKSQATVLSLLGTYEEMVNFLKENELLTPTDLWSIFANLPSDLTHCDLSKVSALKVAQAIASHPNLAPEQVLFFLSQTKGGLRTRALVHKNFPLQILNELIEEAIATKNLANLEKLASNPNFPKNYLDHLISLPILSGEYPAIIKLLCKKSYSNEHFDVLEIFPLDSRHKSLLLSNPATPTRLLDLFCDSFCHEPRLYDHPNISLAIKERGLKTLENLHPALYKVIYSNLCAKEAS